MTDILAQPFEVGKYYPVPDGSQISADRQEPALLLVPLAPRDTLDLDRRIEDYPAGYSADMEVVEFLLEPGTWGPINDFDVACSGLARRVDTSREDIAYKDDKVYRVKLTLVDGAPENSLQILDEVAS